MSPAPSHIGQEPLAIQPTLVVKAMTFVAAPANDSVLRHRRYAIKTLSVPAVRPHLGTSAGEHRAATPLVALPIALVDAWASAHLALWKRCLSDSLHRPIQMVTGASLLRLMGGSLAVSATLAAACMESVADLSGAVLDHGTAPFRR
jgi:hypothetical protein